MRSAGYTLFLILAAILVFSSCTLQKRVHMPGVHIEWNKYSKKSGEKQVAEKHPTQKPNVIPKKDINISQVDVPKQKAEVAEVGIADEQFPVMASSDLPAIISPEKLTAVADYSRPVSPVVRSKSASAKAPVKAATVSGTHSSSEDDGLKAVGWVFIVLGVIILFFVSILIGLILLILGIVFAASGGGKEQPKEQLVDVVYLKNGSIIKGTVIEQIPNERVKIRTSDGSVFVYQMDEIEKITKESR